MGTIFNIQKFSIHDGPGIRTTVFFKGCPLRCPWCSNIESQKKDIQLTWDNKKCTGCNKCIDLNLEEKLKFVKSDDFANVNGEKLLLCTTTQEKAKIYKFECKANALSYEGYEKTADEIMQEVLKDKDFYDESGGGLTISGGEVLFQTDFAIELLQLAKKNNIHTAAETTCYAKADKFKEFVKYLDLLLCDIKHWDSKKHKEIVGVELETIFENIKYAVSLKNLEVIARIPVIPNFNYTLQDAHKLSQKILQLNIKKVNLLPYHNFGENKYRLLTIKYPMGDIKSINKDGEEFIKYKDVFLSYGLDVN